MKTTPIEELINRLTELNSDEPMIIYPDQEFDFFYLKNQIYDYVDATDSKKKEFIRLAVKIEELLISIKGKINSILSNAKTIPTNIHLMWMKIPLSKEQEEELCVNLEKEINAWIEVYEVVTTKKIKIDVNVKPVIASAKDASDKSFVGLNKMTNEQAEELTNLVIECEEEINLFNFQSKEDSEKIKRMFLYPMPKGWGTNIYFSASNKIVGFVFHWLEKKEYFKSSNKAIEHAGLNGEKGNKLTDASLKSTRSQNKGLYNSAITDKQGKKPPIPQSKKYKDIFAMINWQLHEIFSSSK
jgi:hypothetical protein